MRKLIFLGLALSLIALPAARVWAKSAEQEEAEKQAEMKKMVEAKKLEINGTQWEIQVAPQGGAKGTLPKTDTLTFQDGRFTSKSLGKDYPSTNYTLTVEENGNTIFETMQTSEKYGVAFWRGEWKDNVMSGVISRQIEDKSEEYTFTSSSKVNISPTTEEKKEGEAETSAAESAAPSATTTLDSANAGQPKTAAKSAAAKETKKSSWFF